jgi:hypothetical protein
MSAGRGRPDQGEFDEYYNRYVSLVPDGDILEVLRAQLASGLETLSAVSEETSRYRYEDGKWSVKEVLGHIVDTEWTFTYRALHFARGDKSALPGIDQDEWMAAVDFGDISMRDLVEEYAHLRKANIMLFESLNDAVLDRSGVASGVSFTVRSIPYILAGHELHHMKVLGERYGLNGEGS